jgi:hypothetical protein
VRAKVGTPIEFSCIATPLPDLHPQHRVLSDPKRGRAATVTFVREARRCTFDARSSVAPGMPSCAAPDGLAVNRSPMNVHASIGRTPRTDRWRQRHKLRAGDRAIATVPGRRSAAGLRRSSSKNFAWAWTTFSKWKQQTKGSDRRSTRRAARSATTSRLWAARA